MGTPLGCPYACPHRGHALMGWVPYPPHMGPHFVGPITALRAFKKKGCDVVGAGVGVKVRAPNLNLI